MTRVGINGFGRMGRLALRAAAGWPEFEFALVNETAGDAAAGAHLLEFDSVHGRWSPGIEARNDALVVEGHEIAWSSAPTPGKVAWDAAGSRSSSSARAASARSPRSPRISSEGVRKVVVAAPVKEEGALNVVVGVNDDPTELARHDILTAASCTTNCLAPVVKVIHEGIGIQHGVITTLHDMTNTQVVVDAPHKDLRRARASSLSLIPTTTGSATAIGLIFPELQGKLNGLAVRVPMLNASLTDCVFEVARPTTVEEVNRLLRAGRRRAARRDPRLRGAPARLRRLSDDPRSGIVDAPSTMVVDGTQVKVLAWYDNEWGYANRLVELARAVAGDPGSGER